MAYVTISENKLRSVLKIYKRTSGVNPQYVCDCVFCGRKKKMYVNVRTQLFDCKVCHEEGSIIKILRHLGKMELLGGRTVKQEDHIDGIRTIMAKQAEEQDEVTLDKLPVVTMPAGFKTTLSNAYLKSRQIFAVDCKRYNIGTTRLSGRFRNYILLPIYDEGKIRGYIGRYGSKHVPDDKLRYDNSRNTKFGELLYGYDEIIKGKTETVIVVEGCFDKIRTDQNLKLYEMDDIKCVATFGKKISPQQRKKLQLKAVKNLILSYDEDATEEIKKYALELRHYFNVAVAVVKSVNGQKKDLGDCSQEDTLKCFSNLQSVDEFTLSSMKRIKR